MRELSAGYGKKPVVKGASFSLPEGTLTGLLGSNGSGKTTLARAVCGLIPSEGKVDILGQDPRHLKSRDRAGLISYIPQRTEITFSMPVLDVVLMGFYPVMATFESPGKRRREIALHALERVGLASRAYEDYLTLSGGQKQMAVLARAMVRKTPLYLFDEPDSALDFANHHRALGFIRELARAEETAGLMCIHDANFALRYCDNLIFMKEGQTFRMLSLSQACREEVQEALSEIYGPVELLENKGHFLVDRKEDVG